MEHFSKPKKLLLYFLFFYSVLPINLRAYNYEVAFRAINQYDAPVAVSVKVYVYDSTIKDFQEIRSGVTRNTGFTGQQDFEYNGAFDIRLDGNYESLAYRLFDPLPEADIYYVRIGNKYFRMEYHPNNIDPPYINSYGDLQCTYSTETENLSIIKSNTCAYDIYGPYEWSDKTIRMSNKFGNDYLLCSGDVVFDSQVFHNIGFTGITLKREASTFTEVHMASGIDNQNVNSYVRKWRKWQDADNTNIVTILSVARDYDLVATYAKQVSSYIETNVIGCKIKINGIEKNLPSSDTFFYDDSPYQIESFNQIVDYVDYQFEYWNYNGTQINQNILQIDNPSSNITLSLRLKGKPFFYESPESIRGLNVTQILDNPLHLTWNEHPSTKVTNYKIYRKAKYNQSWTDPVCIATVPRGTTSFDDPDYIFLRNSYIALLYSVNAYCQEFNTESDPIFQGPYFGTLNKSSSFANGTVPENSLGNFPNPFNPTTKVSFSIKDNGFVVLQIFDILGNKVSDLVNEFLTSGRYSINFDAYNLPSGLYICSIKANNYSATKKMLLVK